MLRRMPFQLLAAGVGVYVLVCAAVWLFQERLIYFPGGAPSLDPADVGLAYEEVELVAADGVRLHAWFLPAENARGTVLVSHGNAGSIEHRLGLARVFLDMGLSVLLYDYRGYGASAGRPSEEGTYLDAEAAWAHLVERGCEPQSIVAYGESLGGGIAVELTLRRQVGALITESAFTSIPEMAARTYPWLPVRRLARIRYTNVAKIERVGVPWLGIHSPEDGLVPYEQGRELFARAREPKEWLATAGGHNEGGFAVDPSYRRVVAKFLERFIPAPATAHHDVNVESGDGAAGDSRR